MGSSPAVGDTHLARTGMGAKWWVQWAFGLVVLGGLLLAIGDTRTRPSRLPTPPAPVPVRADVQVAGQSAGDVEADLAQCPRELDPHGGR